MDIIELMKKPWKKEEELYLINNYSKKTNKELAHTLNRTVLSVKNKSNSLKLYKDKDFICKIRKRRTDINITKELLIELYRNKKKSIRRIAQKLNIGKTTIRHYLKKYNIKIRDHSEANRERFKWDSPWTKNAPKYKLKNMATKCAKTWAKKRIFKIKKFEEINKINFKQFLEILYINQKRNLSKIGKDIGFGRVIVSQLLDEYGIDKRPKFEYISLIKSEDRYQYGKTWEELFGKEKALIMKRKTSLHSRELIIKRLQSNKMPFSNTKIELMMKKELENKNIHFKFQQPMYNRFVCDFVLPQYKIVLECDGDYWHVNPKIYDRNSPNLPKIQIDRLKRDDFKNKYLIKKGWKVIRFFESDIKRNISKCIDSLCDIINNNSKGDYLISKSESTLSKESKFNKGVIRGYI